MALSCGDFGAWLSKRLSDISDDIDVETFVEYITGILQEDDSSREDKIESLSSFLVEVVPESDVGFISEMIVKTYETSAAEVKEQKQDNKGVSSLDEELSRLMEDQKLTCSVKQTRTSNDHIVNRQAILAQYGEVCSGDEDEDSEDECTGASGGADLFRNINASSVDDKVREQREKMKQAHDEKKERDRLDRERQKQLKQEKADKAKQKTQKQERRR